MKIARGIAHFVGCAAFGMTSLLDEDYTGGSDSMPNGTVTKHVWKDSLLAGKGWELIAGGFGFTDGTDADTDGNIYFPFIANGTMIKRIFSSGERSADLNGLGVSGMGFEPDGRLYVCKIREGRVLVFDREGKRTVLAENVQPNDLVVTREGGLYFTETPKQQVTYISPAGKVRPVSTRQVAKPNGITLSADEGTLAVSEHGGGHVWAFRIDADGRVSAGAPSMRMSARLGGEVAQGDSMTTDAEGCFYETSTLGVQMFDPTGRAFGVILRRGAKPVASVCFAGEGSHWMLVCSGDAIYRRETPARGVLFFP